MIKVNEIIQTGFSADDANKLLEVVQPLVEKGERVELDFSGMEIFTTLFFNNALSRFLVEVGFEKYEKMFKVINLSEVGQSTYQHSIDNAKEYYKMSTEKREDRKEILENFEE